MTERTETGVFVRCRSCSFEIHMPSWVTDELEKRDLKEEPIQMIPCPLCGGQMFEPRILEAMPSLTKRIPVRKKKRKKHK